MSQIAARLGAPARPWGGPGYVHIKITQARREEGRAIRGGVSNPSKNEGKQQRKRTCRRHTASPCAPRPGDKQEMGGRALNIACLGRKQHAAHSPDPTSSREPPCSFLRAASACAASALRPWCLNIVYMAAKIAPARGGRAGSAAWGADTASHHNIAHTGAQIPQGRAGPEAEPHQIRFQAPPFAKRLQ